jgi:hypothetical protein
MEPSTVKKLAKAVRSWLTYQDIRGRGALFSEAYLAHPIGEFLSHSQHGKVQAEINHPTLKVQGPGRPRQIDYAILGRDSSRLTTVLEAKWVSNSNIDSQYVLDDLLRLECVRDLQGQMVYRYFLIAARKQDFQDHFQVVQVNLNGGRASFIQTLLSFDENNPKKRIAIRDTTGNARRFFKSFSERFKTGLPTSFSTALNGLSSDDDFTVMIWQVTSVQRRSLFDPDRQWQ